MADAYQTRAQLVSDFADNTSGAITAQLLRDLLYSTVILNSSGVIDANGVSSIKMPASTTFDLNGNNVLNGGTVSLDAGNITSDGSGNLTAVKFIGPLTGAATGNWVVSSGTKTNTASSNSNGDLIITQNTVTANIIIGNAITGVTTTQGSVFLGPSAGKNCTSANFTVCIGDGAGGGATGTGTENVCIGDQAGQATPNAGSAIFIGGLAGQAATAGDTSIMLGFQAGLNAATAANCIFIGDNCGAADTVNNAPSSAHTSICIGDFSGTGGFSDSIAIGHGVINSAANQVNVGNVLYLTGITGSDTPSATPSATGAGSILNWTVKGRSNLAGQPTDTFSATMTIDVTKSSHIISAANGTSATVTFNASAAGTKGDFLEIVTETDGSGTVTATFGTHFKSAGTQATTLSTFSSIAFRSDGTQWVELYRTTAAT